MCKSFSESRVLVEARNAGWTIGVEDGKVVFTPPKYGNRSNAEIEYDREQIAKAAARVASLHYGWCYDGCK